MEPHKALQTCVFAAITILVVFVLSLVAYRSLRVTASDLGGYWATTGGSQFFLDHSGDGHEFRVTTSSGLYGTVTGDVYAGSVGWPRRVRVDFPGGKARGMLSIDQRAIRWNDGTEWRRQGIN